RLRRRGDACPGPRAGRHDGDRQTVRPRRTLRGDPKGAATMTIRDTPWIRARVVPASGIAGAIERIGPLTPSPTQTTVEAAVAAGRGPPGLLDGRWPAPSTLLDGLRRRVEVLTSRGIHVALRAGEGGGTIQLGRTAA